jgi:hypothetical protein
MAVAKTKTTQDKVLAGLDYIVKTLKDMPQETLEPYRQVRELLAKDASGPGGVAMTAILQSADLYYALYPDELQRSVQVASMIHLATKLQEGLGPDKEITLIP